MLRRSWGDEEIPRAKPTPPPKTINPDDHTYKESHYHEHVKKDKSQKRRKSSGFKSLFITLLVLGGFYFGAGALVQNIGDASWQRKAKEYSIFVWPRVFTMSEEGHGNGLGSGTIHVPYEGSRTSGSGGYSENEDNPPSSHSPPSQGRDEYGGMEEKLEGYSKEMVEEAKELSEIVVKQLPLPIQRKNLRKQLDKEFKKLEEMYDE